MRQAGRLWAAIAVVVTDLAHGNWSHAEVPLEEIALSAELEELPWLARIARGLQAAVLLATRPEDWRPDGCASLVEDCTRDGDRWGSLLMAIFIGTAQLKAGEDRGRGRVAPAGSDGGREPRGPRAASLGVDARGRRDGEAATSEHGCPAEGGRSPDPLSGRDRRLPTPRPRPPAGRRGQQHERRRSHCPAEHRTRAKRLRAADSWWVRGGPGRKAGRLAALASSGASAAAVAGHPPGQGPPPRAADRRAVAGRACRGRAASAAGRGFQCAAEPGRSRAGRPGRPAQRRCLSTGAPRHLDRSHRVRDQAPASQTIRHAGGLVGSARPVRRRVAARGRRR